jgi:hypothetical protein
MAFLDDRGAMLVNSLAPGKEGKPASNIGHPSAPSEVDWFMAMVAKAAPAMTPVQAAVLENYLRHQPK